MNLLKAWFALLIVLMILGMLVLGLTIGAWWGFLHAAHLA